MSMIKTMILRRCYMIMMYYDAKLLCDVNDKNDDIEEVLYDNDVL